MPNRVIRSGFLDSEKINSLNAEEQLFFIRLMLVADDFGCFDARPEMIRSSCFPVTDVCLSDVSNWLARCCQVGLVATYSELGKKYLVIHSFDQRLRQKKRKYPEPNDLEVVSDVCRTDGGHLHATMPESESESESESEKKVEVGCIENDINIHRLSFDTFLKSGPSVWINFEMKAWSAWKLFFKTNPGINLIDLIDSAKAYREYCNKFQKDLQYVIKPHNFLSDRGDWNTDWTSATSQIDKSKSVNQRQFGYQDLNHEDLVETAKKDAEKYSNWK